MNHECVNDVHIWTSDEIDTYQVLELIIIIYCNYSEFTKFTLFSEVNIVCISVINYNMKPAMHMNI